MKQLIKLPQNEQKPVVEKLAEHMLHTLNATLAERVHDHKKFYAKFWRASETPDALLVATGANAGILLAAAQENLEHISRLAAIVGHTLHDYILAEEYEPKRAFIVTNGVVTLAEPAEGFDAWGNAIVESEEGDV